MIDHLAIAAMAFIVLGLYLCVGVLTSLALREGCKIKSRTVVAIGSLLWPLGLILVAVLAIIFGGDDKKDPHD